MLLSKNRQWRGQWQWQAIWALARDTMGWKRLCDAIVRTFTGVSGADNAKA